MWARVATVAALGFLAACAKLPELGQSPVPDLRPAPRATDAPQRSDESLEREAFYQKVEQGLLARGLLRSDGGGPDVPFTDEMLARNFLTLAFSEEFSERGGMISARSRASTLHRWKAPVRIEPVFGSTVDRETVAEDLALMSAYAGRLGRITGHDIVVAEARGNFPVFVLHEQELRKIGPELQARLPQISKAETRFVETLPLDVYCVVFTSDPENDGNITTALAIIRAELPRALRTACYHEELAQGLGLANDSDFARPSIFKDDDEFGRLTTHDEHLLAILFDARLAPGMTETDAAPIVRNIARALMAPAT